MKSLKVLACAACLLGTVSGVGFAKDVQTIAGSMVVPNNVNVVSASKTNTRDFVEKQLNENPSKIFNGKYDGQGASSKLWHYF